MSSILRIGSLNLTEFQRPADNHLAARFAVQNTLRCVFPPCVKLLFRDTETLFYLAGIHDLHFLLLNLETEALACAST